MENLYYTKRKKTQTVSVHWTAFKHGENLQQSGKFLDSKAFREVVPFTVISISEMMETNILGLDPK